MDVAVQDAGWGVPVHGHGGGDALQPAGDCQPLQAQQGRSGRKSVKYFYQSCGSGSASFCRIRILPDWYLHYLRLHVIVHCWTFYFVRKQAYIFSITISLCFLRFFRIWCAKTSARNSWNRSSVCFHRPTTMPGKRWEFKHLGTYLVILWRMVADKKINFVVLWTENRRVFYNKFTF